MFCVADNNVYKHVEQSRRIDRSQHICHRSECYFIGNREAKNSNAKKAISNLFYIAGITLYAA